MPELIPIRGIRPDASRVNPGDLICPPYDVIPPEDHDRLLAHSPWNSVRWILGIDPQKPKGSAEDYRRRGKEVRNWIEEGILRKEEERSLYSYTFRYRSIEGSQRSYHCILGAVRARPWGEGILRHEEIRPRVVDDRQLLLKESAVDTGVVQLVSDGLDEILARCGFDQESGEFLYEVKDWAENTHILRKISDPDLLSRLQSALDAVPAVVADGHHRYTSAMQTSGEDEFPGGGHVLAVIGDLRQPGLSIEPTHRCINFSGEDPAQSAKGGFDLLVTTLDDGEGESWRVELADGTSRDLNTRLSREKPTLVRRIYDTLIEHGATFRTDTPHDSRVARSLLNEKGEGSLLCMLPGVSRDEFWGRCLNGEVFPPKTTYFEPKICTGLVTRLIDEEFE